MREIERMEKGLRETCAKGYTVTIMNALAFLAGYQEENVSIDDVYELLAKLRSERLLKDGIW